jgi:hypothetical protein
VILVNSNKPAWWNLFLGMLSLLASFIWPYIEKLAPPFGADMWGQILVWVIGAVLAAIFGWNAKVASVKKSIANQKSIYGAKFLKS